MGFMLLFKNFKTVHWIVNNCQHRAIGLQNLFRSRTVNRVQCCNLSVEIWFQHKYSVFLVSSLTHHIQMCMKKLSPLRHRCDCYGAENAYKTGMKWLHATGFWFISRSSSSETRASKQIKTLIHTNILEFRGDW